MTRLNKNSKILVAGHKGMVGSSIVKLLNKKGYKNLLTINKKKLNLLDQKKTFEFLKKNKPDAVIIAAARVGGINANNVFRGEFLYQNLQIQNNLIHGSYLIGTKKLIFLGSSCIYPRNCKQPIKEEYLLTSKLEYTNEPYSIAKIAGAKLIESYNYQYGTKYLCLMPCNLYGENDNYDFKTSHFLPALINKTFQAIKNNKKSVTLWGNGKAKRELMHVDDLAYACLFFLKKGINLPILNIGSGEELTITQFAKKVFSEFNYDGSIKYDNSMPNGTPRKILDCSKANSFGWRPKLNFEEGLKITIKDFIKKQKKL